MVDGLGLIRSFLSGLFSKIINIAVEIIEYLEVQRHPIYFKNFTKKFVEVIYHRSEAERPKESVSTSR
jgi:hypothetical protein